MNALLIAYLVCIYGLGFVTLIKPMFNPLLWKDVTALQLIVGGVMFLLSPISIPPLFIMAMLMGFWL